MLHHSSNPDNFYRKSAFVHPCLFRFFFASQLELEQIILGIAEIKRIPGD